MLLIKLIKTMYFWIKGMNSLEKNSFIDALYYLNKIDKEAAYKNYFYCSVRAFLNFMLGFFENAKLDSTQALMLIEESKKLNRDEKNYLKEYNLVIICLVAASNIDCKNELKNLNYNIDNVSSRLLRLPKISHRFSKDQEELKKSNKENRKES